MSTLERAIALAAAAHTGQSDKAGAPYIMHPLRVMAGVSGETRRIAAVLHDVVERTPVTFKWLRELGFSEEVIEIVNALTKRPEEEGDERYFDFVVRAATHDLARDVKRSDLLDNMDLVRSKKAKPRDAARFHRYRRALKLVESIGRHDGEYRESAPTILPLTNRVTAAEVGRECPWEAPIYACDFAIEGAEDDGSPGGLRLGRILNVDHHGDVERMRQPVTSTQLAYDHLKANSAIEAASWVVINHTDCDSVLSSAMLMGLIDAKKKFVEAARCADHTGEENPITDLLQALDESRHGQRTDDQYLESIRNLRLLLKDRPLEPAAAAYVALRAARRATAVGLVEAGVFDVHEGIAVAVLDEEIDGVFFVSLIPDAALIMIARQHPDDADRWLIKLRLGNAAPPGLTIHALGVHEWDKNYNGRWNAGGNKRPPADGELGGTTMSAEDYAGELHIRLREWRARSDQPVVPS